MTALQGNIQNYRAELSCRAAVCLQERQSSGQEEDTHEGESLLKIRVSNATRTQDSDTLTIRHSLLRPLVSIKKRVGIVERTWIAPYPSEAYNACVSVYPAATKILEL